LEIGTTINTVAGNYACSVVDFNTLNSSGWMTRLST
jgi:hypothetical protein